MLNLQLESFKAIMVLSLFKFELTFVALDPKVLATQFVLFNIFPKKSPYLSFLILAFQRTLIKLILANSQMVESSFHIHDRYFAIGVPALELKALKPLKNLRMHVHNSSPFFAAARAILLALTHLAKQFLARLALNRILRNVLAMYTLHDFQLLITSLQHLGQFVFDLWCEGLDFFKQGCVLTGVLNIWKLKLELLIVWELKMLVPEGRLLEV